MSSADDRPADLTLAEFVKELEDGFRAAGLEGAFQYEETLGILVHPSGVGCSVLGMYQRMSRVPAENRLPTIAKLTRALARREEVPVVWADARERLLPQLKRRMEIAVEMEARSPLEGSAPRPLAQITPHLAFEVVVVVDDLISLLVPGETYGAWGVSHDEAFRAAAENLVKRSVGFSWLATPEAPGVYRSPWRDGFDASRLFLPPVFGTVPLRGRPVVVSPTPSMLLYAGSDDEEGLRHLAALALKVLERQPGFHSLRPVRMGEDGGSWVDWLPEPGHPARGGLRLLRAVEEKHDYDQQSALRRRHPNPEIRNSPAPSLVIVAASPDADPMTVTCWRAGAPAGLPKADAIVFVREDETLGWAEWHAVAAALPGELDPLPNVYPSRHLAAEFPEDWQLSGMDLEPWEGPLPE
jgi:hypothetical protein